MLLYQFAILLSSKVFVFLSLLSNSQNFTLMDCHIRRDNPLSLIVPIRHSISSALNNLISIQVHLHSLKLKRLYCDFVTYCSYSSGLSALNLILSKPDVTTCFHEILYLPEIPVSFSLRIFLIRLHIASFAVVSLEISFEILLYSSHSETSSSGSFTA